MNEKGVCIWSERFTSEELKNLRMTIGSDIAWRTEYLLEEAGYDGQIVDPKWIQWADCMPK